MGINVSGGSCRSCSKLSRYDDIVVELRELGEKGVNVSDERKEESRHIVRLDVRIGRVVIRDQFEWDLSERMNNADAFAERLCADLGLNTEHVGSCLLYTSPSPRDQRGSRMPSSA